MIFKLQIYKRNKERKPIATNTVIWKEDWEKGGLREKLAIFFLAEAFPHLEISCNPRGNLNK